MIFALLELQFAELSRANTFNCNKCTPQLKKIRRCEDIRMDLDAEDNPIFPIRLLDGGTLFGFCPGKATKDPYSVGMFQSLVAAKFCGYAWQPGCIVDQPAWWIELLSNFVVRYDQLSFFNKAGSVLGSNKDSIQQKGKNLKRGK